MKKIIMTGGGTAGHVTPNIALFPVLKKLGYDIHYIGTEKGMERELIERENIPYHFISAGKLRRYIDLQNFYDIFRVIKGFFQALLIIRKLKPDVVFSKGGFVSCPVVWAAWINGIPAIVHESDITPGLANKLSIPFASKVCFTFPETSKHLPKEKRIHTGLPVRENLLVGNGTEGKKICGFTDDKPVLVVIGGSLGSEVLNRVVRTSLKEILEQFQICHICGRGGIDGSLFNVNGYKQFEYVNQELPHLFAMADVIVSRAGATVLYELLALKKPNLLIPLSKLASRGDQILNAGSFEKQGFSKVIIEEELNESSFLNNIKQLYNNRAVYINAMKTNSDESAADKVVSVINNV